jgi:hypothetical protein
VPAHHRTSTLSAFLGGGPALLPMDLAAEYLRGRIWHVLPPFLLAVGPLSAAVLVAIDVSATQHRAAVAEAGVFLTVATIWRWVWLAVVQRRVQADLRGRPPAKLRRRIVPILLVRLFAFFAVVWGWFLIVPAFYGLLLGGLAAPMMLERQGPAWNQTRDALVWVHKSAGRLLKVTSALLVLALLTVVSVVALQLLLVNMILPSILGVDTADLALTVQSVSWVLCVLYFLFVVFDLYWTVLSVMLYYDLQSRRLGTDLRSRLIDQEQHAA